MNTKELWSSKLLGRYHFVGPVKLRSLNVYRDKPFSIDVGLSKFGKTLAAKLGGKEYYCSWVIQERSDTKLVALIKIVRKDPKIPIRCKYPISCKVEITLKPV